MLLLIICRRIGQAALFGKWGWQKALAFLSSLIKLCWAYLNTASNNQNSRSEHKYYTNTAAAEAGWDEVEDK